MLFIQQIDSCVNRCQVNDVLFLFLLFVVTSFDFEIQMNNTDYYILLIDFRFDKTYPVVVDFPEEVDPPEDVDPEEAPVVDSPPDSSLTSSTVIFR